MQPSFSAFLIVVSAVVFVSAFLGHAAYNFCYPPFQQVSSASCSADGPSH